MSHLILPTRALRVDIGIVERPPWHTDDRPFGSAQGWRLTTGDRRPNRLEQGWSVVIGHWSVVEASQVAKSIGITELAEQPGLLGPPTRRELVDQATIIWQVTVEMVVVIFGMLIQQPAVGL